MARQAWRTHLGDVLPPRPPHPLRRCLLLLVPLTWPGIVYGLWQRRRGLWLSKPRSYVEQSWHVVGAFVREWGIAATVCAGILGVLVGMIFGGMWLFDHAFSSGSSAPMVSVSPPAPVPVSPPAPVSPAPAASVENFDVFVTQTEQLVNMMMRVGSFFGAMVVLKFLWSAR